MGILDAAVARGGPPSAKVVLWSAGLGAMLFLTACVLRVDEGMTAQEYGGEMDQGMIDATIGFGVVIVVALSFGVWLAKGLREASAAKPVRPDRKA